MKPILSLLLILALLAGVYFFTQKTSAKKVYPDRAFAIEDKSEIDIVTIKKPGYPEIHLSKGDHYWLLNQRRRVSDHVMNNLLSVLTSIEIDYLPPRPQLPKVISDLKSHGIEVAIYNKSGQALSEYTVGKNTTDEGGTFMRMKNADQPYVMRAPAVSGGVRVYYSMKDIDFREKSIMTDLKVGDIQKLTLDYKRDRSNSYVIEKQDSDWSIEPILKNRSEDLKQNQNILDAYMQSFKKIGAEYIMTGDPAMDSLNHLMPFAEMKLDLKNGQSLGYSFYPDFQVLEPDSILRTTQDLKKTHRHYVLLNDGESYVVQQRLLKDLFKPLGYFHR